MKHRAEWKIAIVSIICLAAFIGFAQGQETDGSDSNVKGEVRFRYDFFEVNGDRGRFREDNWMTDQSTGGLDWLHLESTEPDENGYEWLLEGRAMYDYDYDMSFLMKKEDSHYLKLDFSSLRRYYDGSNVYWDEGIPRMLERSDGGLFVDRRNYNIEFGLTPPEGAQWVFGWHRLVKDGKETLLSNSRRLSGSFRGLANVLDTRGITDTIYGEVSWTVAEKYNFRIRQEFEQYHGDSKAFVYARLNDNWIASDPSRNTYHVDNLGYTNWRTMLMFDSFLDDRTYVTTNYMYNYLNSNSTQTYFDNGVINWEERSVGNSRRTNVGGLAYRKTDFMQVPGLTLGTGIRVEDSKTSSQSMHYEGSLYQFKSSLDEVRVAESIRLVYKGIDRTTLSFDADLEQRDLDWSARRISASDDFDRDTDTDFTDQVYTLKAVHRHDRNVKSTVKFRIKDQERSMTNLYRRETDPTAYPGALGSYRIKGNDITLKTDFRHNSKTNSTLMYQFVQESRDFSLGGKTSNMEIHRGLGSISFIPKDNLFFVGTFMLENYVIDTPAVTSIGSSPWDYSGTSYTLMLNGTYAFNSKTSATLGFQHTEAMGDISNAGDYVYDKFSLGLNHKLAANQTIGLGYQFYNFENQAKDSGDFDDYRVHGMFATYSYTF